MARGIFLQVATLNFGDRGYSVLSAIWEHECVAGHLLNMNLIGRAI
jgi:hypothetical protein